MVFGNGKKKKKGEGEVVIRDCVKRGWSVCGTGGGGSNRDGKIGEEENETNCRRKRNIPLVYMTDFPVHVQEFQIPVTTNVDSHMQITRQQTWVERELV